MTPIALARLDELADGRSRGFDPLGEGRDTMFLVRRGDRVVGWRNACPHHEGARMAWRRHEYLDAAAAHIRCAGHGALFGIDDGVCIEGACLGAQLEPVALAIVAGVVTIAGPYRPGTRAGATLRAAPPSAGGA